MPKVSPERCAYLKSIAANRVRMKGWVAFLAKIHAGPCTTADLVEATGIGRLSVLMATRHFLRAGIIHRRAWHRPVPHAKMVPTWAWGREGDISMPEYEERVRRPRPAPSTLVLLSTVLDLIRDTPMRNREISEEIAMSMDTVGDVMRELRAHKMVRVGSWHKPPVGCTVAEWVMGSGPDARRPPTTKTKAGQRAAKSDRRQRDDQLKFMHALAGTSIGLRSRKVETAILELEPA